MQIIQKTHYKFLKPHNRNVAMPVARRKVASAPEAGPSAFDSLSAQLWSSLGRSRSILGAFKFAPAILAAATMALPLTSTANIWSNGLPDGTFSWISDLSNNADTEADDFSLGQAETITGFRWWGAYGDANGNALPTPLPTDDFSIFILDDDGAGNPSTINQSFAIGSGATRSNTGDSTPLDGDPSATVGGSERDIFEFAFDLGSPINLSAGDYFLVFRNNVAEQDVFWTWATSNNNTPGTDAEGTPADRFVSSVDLDEQTWAGPFEDQLAFEIVPEPQHYTAIGGLLALVTVIMLRRRR